MEYLYAIDLAGTLVFAISGALAAADKKFDIFGATVMALVTAVGGGTLRDVMIGSTPVGWMQDLNYLYCILIAVLISFFFKKHILRLRKTMFLFDTIGIGLFTVLGAQKTLDIGLAPIIAVLMGTVSAVFGGVLRDVLSNEVPLILRKEIYATACLAGGGMFVLLGQVNVHQNLRISLSIGVVMGVRLLAIWKSWSLPKIS